MPLARRILPPICLLLCATGALAAEPARVQGPEGASLVLSGDLGVSGRLPLALSPLPGGSHRFEIRGAGWEAARGRVELRDGQWRFDDWTGPAGLVPLPGLAHMVRGEARGALHLGSFVLGAAAWWRTEREGEDARERFDRARSAFVGAADDSSRAVAGRGRDDARRREIDEGRLGELWLAYSTTLAVGAFLEAWWLTPEIGHEPGRDGTHRIAAPASSGWRALGRSLLVPGSGQRAIGRTLRADLISGTVSALVAGSILAQSEVLVARRAASDALQRLGDPYSSPEVARGDLEAARSDENDWRVTRNWLVGGAAAVYAWNLLDAFRGGQAGSAPAPGLEVSAVPTTGGVAVLLTRRFD